MGWFMMFWGGGPSMNVYRVSGDMSHLLAILILLLQLHKAKNARGVSVKTQELRLLVFVTRYLDLFTKFYSIYNSLLKITYIFATSFIIIKIKYTEPIKSIYNSNQDSFLHWKLAVFPCLIISFMIHVCSDYYVYRGFSIMEWLWTFSICLESLAILPQLLVLQKYKLVENLTGKFIFFLGLYRFMYILNWIYRIHHQRGYKHHWFVTICGIIQTLLYVDFFYQYFRALNTATTTCCHRCLCRSERQDQVGDDMINNVVIMDDDDEDDETTDLIFEMSRRTSSSATAVEGGRDHDTTTMTKRSINRLLTVSSTATISSESAREPLLQPGEQA